MPIRNRALSPWDERHHRAALAPRHRRAHRPGSYPDDDLAQTPRRQTQIHQVARQTIPSPRLASTQPTTRPGRGDL